MARGATRPPICSTFVPERQPAFAARAIMACHGGADVAEPVDAGDLKSPAPRGVRVRVPPSAPPTSLKQRWPNYGCPSPMLPVSGSSTKGTFKLSALVYVKILIFNE